MRAVVRCEGERASDHSRQACSDDGLAKRRCMYVVCMLYVCCMYVVCMYVRGRPHDRKRC